MECMTDQENQTVEQGVKIITKYFNRLLEDMESGNHNLFISNNLISNEEYTPQYKRELEIYAEGICLGVSFAEKSKEQ